MEESCGAYLKRQREMRKVRLEQIAQTTKVSLVCLQAIEAEDWERLPNPAFVRGFVRSYAQAIGLNPEEVVLQFEAELKKMNEGGVRGQLTKRPSSVGPMKVAPWDYFVVLIVVVMIGVYWSSH